MPRTPEHQARRARAAELVPDLRTARADLRTALKALPSPATRTPAQRRDALQLRTLALVVQAVLVLMGVAGQQAADLEQTET